MKRLRVAVNSKPDANGIYLDATIQRFEFCFELAWKLMKAMLDTGAQQAALTHYEYVIDLFYSEFGINLSNELTDLYKEIIKTTNGVEVDLIVIRDSLQEEEGRGGAFYCEYSLFKEIYHLECRAASRSGQSIYLCLMSVTDGNNQKLS